MSSPVLCGGWSWIQAMCTTNTQHGFGKSTSQVCILVSVDEKLPDLNFTYTRDLLLLLCSGDVAMDHILSDIIYVASTVYPLAFHRAFEQMQNNTYTTKC